MNPSDGLTSPPLTSILKPSSGANTPANFFTPPNVTSSTTPQMNFLPPSSAAGVGYGSTIQPFAKINHKKKASNNKKAVKGSRGVQIDTPQTYSPFIITPKAVKIQNDTIVPVVMVLSFPVSSSTDIVIVLNEGGKEAKVTFTTPSILLKPSRMMPNNATKNKASNKQGVCYNACTNHLYSLVKKRGDRISFDIVLDLPFACEPKVASKLLDDKLEGNPVFKTYCGPTWDDDSQFDELANPSDFMHTLVLLFKKVDDGFKAVTKVVTNHDISLQGGESSSDDDVWG